MAQLYELRSTLHPAVTRLQRHEKSCTNRGGADPPPFCGNIGGRLGQISVEKVIQREIEPTSVLKPGCEKYKILIQMTIRIYSKVIQRDIELTPTPDLRATPALTVRPAAAGASKSGSTKINCQSYNQGWYKQ